MGSSENSEKKIRVLLADDHKVFREGIASILDKISDIEVVGMASNGEEAVSNTKRLLPDVVLMDIAMPVLNGLDATIQIKKYTPETKVLILTMYETEQYVSQMLKIGAEGYVVKTADSLELVSAIRAVNRGDVYLYSSIAQLFIKDYLKNIKSKPADIPDHLTQRELQVLKYIADGRKNKEIANLLGISVRTAQAHRTNLMSKVGAHDRTELVKYAIRAGLIDPQTW